MKKILQFITGGLIKDIGQIIDDLVTTDEERLAAKQKVEDMKSDSFLSKNIRPMVLIYLTFIFSVLAFFDGNIGEFSIAEDYIPIFQSLLITVYGAYFVGRTWEKGKKISNNK